MDWTLRAAGISKSYDGGETYANRDLGMEVAPGEVYGLLGPNGAGKTTLVKQIIGLLRPDDGTLTLGPHDLIEDPDAARQLCSYLPQAQMPINSFKAREAIAITGMIRGGAHGEVTARRDELIEALDIGEWRDTLGARLSGGVKRLVGFAMVTVVPGRVVILDEPTNDVDPARRRLLWEQVRVLGDGGAAVLLVTHNVLEAEKAVDRLAIIDEGRILAEGTPSALKAADRDRMRLQMKLVPGSATPAFPPFVIDHTRVRNTLIAVVPEQDGSAAIEWARRQMQAGAIEEYSLGATTLEDVYIRLTGDLEASRAAPR